MCGYDEHDLAIALEHGRLVEEWSDEEDHQLDAWSGARPPSGSRKNPQQLVSPAGEWPDFAADDADDRQAHLLQRRGYDLFVDDTALGSSSNSFYTAGSSKRSRDRFEATDSNSVRGTLKAQGAVATMLYRNSTPDAQANDIWPAYRNAAKLPARYYLLDTESTLKQRPKKIVRRSVDDGKQSTRKDKEPSDAVVGRPKWDLPVELVEVIASYLNRDDIKSLRMTSRELDYYVSQVIFKTVVVPFNTEIYGMLAKTQKLDLKGKKRAKLDHPGYSWKNANGNEVYNGHGIDVFKGFGRHILRYGMSFEVNEDSLSQPPAKSLTEKKTSFWGDYDWPYEEYRRFDAVAGLETAADETPRMKIAFSELTRIKELALSIDSGLGWLNGPDRSIRARILQRPPAVFGTLKDVPDRRAQAQQELWRHIERRHQAAGQDVKLATLYRLDKIRPLSDAEESAMMAEEQPDMPYLDPHLMHEATPHDTNEVSLPATFDDPEVLDRFVAIPSSTGAGIIFSSNVPPTDAGQIMNPIMPANLTKAQKEWLLETEWAQRAFMSSYMLSIIDNPSTFTPVHTLNISRLSDRYLSMLNRVDFWDALPNLRDLTIMVIPGFRTVQKDEAGFVDTPRVNPVAGLDTFFEILGNHVSHRSGIKSLTIGWIGGGEHAEGLHARNKLLMPAPLMMLKRRLDNGWVSESETMTELDASRLRSALLRLPHVERFTLKNCWITPTALLQFVKLHDTLCLQHLVLDSVSLTAILRQNANGNQAGPQGGAVNFAPLLPGPFHGNIALNGVNAILNAITNIVGQNANPAYAHGPLNHAQLLQWIVQSLQTQPQHMQANAVGAQQQNQINVLQAQVQTQLAHLQGTIQPPALHQQGQPQVPAPTHPVPLPGLLQQTFGGHFAFTAALANQVQALQQQIAVPAQQIFQHPTNTTSLLQAQPREGSWTDIIDIISTGTNLSDFASEHSKADPDRITSLRTIEFISCGYAKLPHTTFDQAGIEHGNGLAAVLRNSVFSKRHAALAPAMMNAKWTHLGEIVQEVDQTELAVLDAAWNLKTGWEDAEEARGVEFDGGMPGGTGRFTGCLRREDRMREKGEGAVAV